MKGVKLGPVNDCRLVTNKHLAAVIKRVDYDCTSVSEPDLEN